MMENTSARQEIISHILSLLASISLSSVGPIYHVHVLYAWLTENIESYSSK